ncbi:MAG TPA: hypothetical protein VLV86_09200, partial [Vicinamibacterales bacterium]|nr:hypothetical protein [Vicinamibacterales bacterium]
MDFSKLKAGVVDFSAFLVGHTAWLAATLLSLWIALGSRLTQPVARWLAGSMAFLNQPDVASL